MPAAAQLVVASAWKKTQSTFMNCHMNVPFQGLCHSTRYFYPHTHTYKRFFSLSPIPTHRASRYNRMFNCCSLVFCVNQLHSIVSTERHLMLRLTNQRFSWFRQRFHCEMSTQCAFFCWIITIQHMIFIGDCIEWNPRFPWA